MMDQSDIRERQKAAIGAEPAVPFRPAAEADIEVIAAGGGDRVHSMRHPALDRVTIYEVGGRLIIELRGHHYEVV